MRELSGPMKAAIFYVITLGLALVVSLFAGQLGEDSTVVTMLTPAVAVLIMLLLVAREGRAGWQQLGVTRAGLKGWPFAILGSAAILIATYAILWATPLADLKPAELPRGLVDAILNISIGVLVSVAFAMFEEVGWRGYMLPKLAAIGAVPATLIVGFLHGVWHLPLMLTTPYYHASGSAFISVPLFLVTLTLAGIFYGYLRLWTGSVWPVAIAHGVYNMTWNILDEMTAANSPTTTEYIGGESGVLVIVVLIVMAAILIPKVRNLEMVAARDG